MLAVAATMPRPDQRRAAPQVKREFKRQAATEPVIGHLKEHHRMAEITLPMPAATPSTLCSPPPAGYNSRRLLAWSAALKLTAPAQVGLNPASSRPADYKIQHFQN
jgi:hypothetical protein